MSIIKKNQPESFNVETTTVWSFPKRGNWATHDSKFRGNWAPQIPRNLILRYSKLGDIILDQMCGCGTALIECKLTGRNAIGFDINPKMVELSRNNLKFDIDDNIPKTDINIEFGDARHLKEIDDDSVDLIATHPPYADIIKYSEGKIEGDLSNIHNIDKFCDEIEKKLNADELTNCTDEEKEEITSTIKTLREAVSNKDTSYESMKELLEQLQKLVEGKLV